MAEFEPQSAVSLATLAFVCACAFGAGLIDAIAGGGGLVQLPALLVSLPHTPLPTLFGTNKLASMAGTAIATGRYLQRVPVRWGITAPAALIAFVCSWLGSHLVGGLSPAIVRPVVLLLLIGVALVTFLRRDYGLASRFSVPPRLQLPVSLLFGGAIGFYDGFFGPGTGTFLIFAFIAAFGVDFLEASASAKVVNLATNLAAVLSFGAIGAIRYDLALPMAACNIAGALVGAHLALARGNSWIRNVFQFVIGAMILRYGYDVWRQFG